MEGLSEGVGGILKALSEGFKRFLKFPKVQGLDRVDVIPDQDEVVTMNDLIAIRIP